MINILKPRVIGKVKITDDLGNIILDKHNAIHQENFSISIARALASEPEGHIQTMYFGNGGSVTNGVGQITYFTPNVTGIDADLYNPTFYKVIDDFSSLNKDNTVNTTKVKHLIGNLYSDIVVNCTLEYNEPSGQQAFDDAVNSEGDFVFDEIGLKTFDVNPTGGLLLTHIIFAPVLKSLNRKFNIEYTLRIDFC